MNHKSGKSTTDQASWKEQDRHYHEDPQIVAAYHGKILRQFLLEFKYLTVDPWIEKIRLLADPLILDFGSGSGVVTLRLLAQGFRVVSLDASPAMLACLRTEASAQGLKSECVVGDAENLPFGPEHFDAVVCTGVLHHLYDIDRGLANQIRVLKKGGWLFISEPYQHKPFVSWPYHALMALVKAVKKIMRPSGGPATQERPLSRGHLERIRTRLQAEGFDYSIQYTVYWPQVFGRMPEGIAYPLMRLANGLRGWGKRGDIVVITGRKGRKI